LGNIDYTTSNNDGYYSNYTCSQWTPLELNTTYNATIRTGTSNNEGAKVYIDYNDNGIFDAGEVAVSFPANKDGLRTLTFTTPSTGVVLNKGLRLRVLSKFGSVPSAGCDISTYGQAEDYTVYFNVITNSITTGTINSPLCQGAAINVPYTINGAYNSGNVFTAQLSDATGSFASPVSIGTLTTTSAGTILATIPLSTAYGTGYKIRVISSNPAITGSANAANITINSNPVPVITGALAFCSGSSTTLDAGAYSSYLWSTAATTQTIPVSTAGTYSVTVTNSNGCTAASSPVTTEVNPLPTPSISGALTFCAGSSSTLDAGSYAGYLWSTGATTQAIPVSIANTYTVTVTNSNNCTAVSAPVTTIVNSSPTITLDASAVNIAAGSTSANLTYSATTETPVTYSITYDAAAISMGFANVNNATLSGGTIGLIIPAGAAATDYNATLTVKNSNGCESVTYPIVITVYGFSFTTSKDIGTTVLLTWTQIPGASYTIQYRQHQPVGNWVGTPAYTQNQVKLVNLQANTEYDCRVYIYKNGTIWSVSNIGTFTTANVTYNKTQDIGTTAQLSWDNIAPWANNYTLQYRTAGLTPGAWVAVPAGNNTQVKLANLIPDRDYDCRVNVYANGGLWGICQLGTFHTGVVGFNATQDIGTTLLLDWTSFAPWASAYTVQYRKVGVTQWTGVSAGGSNQVKLVNLLPDQDYECRVYVFKNNVIWGCSGVSTIHTGKVDFTTLADNGTSIQIEWPSVTGWAASNTLQYSLPALTTWITTSNSANNSVILTPVLNGQDYYVRLLTYTPTGLWGITKEQKIGRSAPGGKQFSALDNNTSDLTVSLYLYPNPFAEQINLEITSARATNCTWSVYDITGKQVMSGTQDLLEGNKTLNIDAVNLANGVYMLNAVMNNEKYSFRILKQ
jgi:hypothetical protein